MGKREKRAPPTARGGKKISPPASKTSETEEAKVVEEKEEETPRELESDGESAPAPRAEEVMVPVAKEIEGDIVQDSDEPGKENSECDEAGKEKSACDEAGKEKSACDEEDDTPQKDCMESAVNSAANSEEIDIENDSASVRSVVDDSEGEDPAEAFKTDSEEEDDEPAPIDIKLCGACSSQGEFIQKTLDTCREKKLMALQAKGRYKHLYLQCKEETIDLYHRAKHVIKLATDKMAELKPDEAENWEKVCQAELQELGSSGVDFISEDERSNFIFKINGLEKDNALWREKVRVHVQSIADLEKQLAGTRSENEMEARIDSLTTELAEKRLLDDEIAELKEEKNALSAELKKSEKLRKADCKSCKKLSNDIEDLQKQKDHLSSEKKKLEKSRKSDCKNCQKLSDEIEDLNNQKNALSKELKMSGKAPKRDCGSCKKLEEKLDEIETEKENLSSKLKKAQNSKSGGSSNKSSSDLSRVLCAAGPLVQTLLAHHKDQFKATTSSVEIIDVSEAASEGSTDDEQPCSIVPGFFKQLSYVSCFFAPPPIKGGPKKSDPTVPVRQLQEVALDLLVSAASLIPFDQKDQTGKTVKEGMPDKAFFGKQKESKVYVPYPWEYSLTLEDCTLFNNENPTNVGPGGRTRNVGLRKLPEGLTIAQSQILAGALVIQENMEHVREVVNNPRLDKETRIAEIDVKVKKELVDHIIDGLWPEPLAALYRTHRGFLKRDFHDKRKLVIPIIVEMMVKQARRTHNKSSRQPISPNELVMLETALVDAVKHQFNLSMARRSATIHPRILQTAVFRKLKRNLAQRENKLDSAMTRAINVLNTHFNATNGIPSSKQELYNLLDTVPEAVNSPKSGDRSTSSKKASNAPKLARKKKEPLDDEEEMTDDDSNTSEDSATKRAKKEYPDIEKESDQIADDEEIDDAVDVLEDEDECEEDVEDGEEESNKLSRKKSRADHTKSTSKHRTSKNGRDDDQEPEQDVRKKKHKKKKTEVSDDSDEEELEKRKKRKTKEREVSMSEDDSDEESEDDVERKKQKRRERKIKRRDEKKRKRRTSSSDSDGDPKPIVKKKRHESKSSKPKVMAKTDKGKK